MRDKVEGQHIATSDIRITPKCFKKSWIKKEIRNYAIHSLTTNQLLLKKHPQILDVQPRDNVAELTAHADNKNLWNLFLNNWFQIKNKITTKWNYWTDSILSHTKKKINGKIQTRRQETKSSNDHDQNKK